MKENKKVNKLKKFVKDHEDVIVIAGCAVGVAAGVGLMYLGFRKTTKISVPDLKYLVGKDKNIDSLLEIARMIDKGTAGHSIETFTKDVTIAEYFGDYAETFLAGSRYKPDDIVSSVIYNIAKKAET